MSGGQHRPRHLVILDAGSTLLMVRSETRRQQIREVSPLPAEQISRIVHEQVMTMAYDEFTPGRIGALAARLGIPVDQFPYRPDVSGQEFVLSPAAPTVVASLARVARVAVLSNMTAFDAHALRAVLTAGLRDIEQVWLSCEIGVAKPDARAFHLCAEAVGVPVENCVMIGDSFPNDIAGALNAGMRAGWLNRDRHRIPAMYAGHVAAGRLVEADSLADVADAAARLWLPLAGGTGLP